MKTVFNKKIFKVTYYFYLCLSVLFISWLILSWLEIGIFNIVTGYEYSKFNLIKMLVGLFI